MPKSTTSTEPPLSEIFEEFPKTCFPLEEKEESDSMANELEDYTRYAHIAFVVFVLAFFLPMTVALPLWLSALFVIGGISFSYLYFHRCTQIKRRFNFRVFVNRKSPLNKFNNPRKLHTVLHLMLAVIAATVAFAGLFITGSGFGVSMIAGLFLGSFCSKKILGYFKKHLHRISYPRFNVWLERIISIGITLILCLMGDFITASEAVPFLAPMEKADIAREISHPSKILEVFARLAEYARLSVTPILDAISPWLMKVISALPHLGLVAACYTIYRGIEQALSTLLDNVFPHLQPNPKAVS